MAMIMITTYFVAIPDFGAPENQPHDMNVTEGDTITILCQPNALPDATIQWFKDTVAFDRKFHRFAVLNAFSGDSRCLDQLVSYI